MSAVTKRRSITQAERLQGVKILHDYLSGVQQSLTMLSPLAQTAYQLGISQLTLINQEFPSCFHLQQNQPQIEQIAQTLSQQHGLSARETLQISTLLRVSQLQVESPQLVQEALQPLISAPSLRMAQQASQKALEQLHQSHHNLFVQQVTQACTQAAIQVGFTQLVQTPTLVGDTIRLVAKDDMGKSLVTEIQVNPNQPVDIATELIGTSDRSCEKILDAYDQALTAAGIKSAPPERTFTGGICELAAAREFIRHQVKPKPATTNSNPTSSQRKRPQPPRQIKQKQ